VTVAQLAIAWVLSRGDARRWLGRVSVQLAAIVESDAPASARLRRWIEELSRTKRRISQEDPELFDTYVRIVAESRDVVDEHLRALGGRSRV
jgi:hypothetical protein